MKRPRLISPCVADRYHAAGERIAEISFNNMLDQPAGCLVRMWVRDGVPHVEVYATDGAVRVIAPRVQPEAAS